MRCYVKRIGGRVFGYVLTDEGVKYAVNGCDLWTAIWKVCCAAGLDGAGAWMR